MLASALRRHVADRAFENFQQRLLHAFAGNVARDGHVLRLARDLVDLVNVNDAALRAFHVVIGVLQQAQNDVLHVFAHVTGFGQRRRVGDGKRHVENLRQRARQQRFAGTRRPDHQNVALLDLDSGVRIHRRGFGGGVVLLRGRFRLDALVMIVHRDGQSFLRVLLADAIQVELAFDFRRLGNGELRRLCFLACSCKFLVEDVFAKDDAVVADVNARPGDELSDFRVRFAAETAQRDVGWARHSSDITIHDSPLSKQVGVILFHRPDSSRSQSGISLRDCTTSSTRP